MVDIMVSDFKKGRYNLMKIFVGIDIAKLNHFAAAISSDGEILIEPFKFTNDADGFQLLVSKLESFDKNSIIIGLESTAHYGDNLVRYLRRPSVRSQVRCRVSDSPAHLSHNQSAGYIFQRQP